MRICVTSTMPVRASFNHVYQSIMCMLLQTLLHLLIPSCFTVKQVNSSFMNNRIFNEQKNIHLKTRILFLKEACGCLERARLTQ